MQYRLRPSKELAPSNAADASVRLSKSDSGLLMRPVQSVTNGFEEAPNGHAQVVPTASVYWIFLHCSAHKRAWTEIQGALLDVGLAIKLKISLAHLAIDLKLSILSRKSFSLWPRRDSPRRDLHSPLRTEALSQAKRYRFTTFDRVQGPSSVKAQSAARQVSKYSRKEKAELECLELHTTLLQVECREGADHRFHNDSSKQTSGPDKDFQTPGAFLLYRVLKPREHEQDHT